MSPHAIIFIIPAMLAFAGYFLVSDDARGPVAIVSAAAPPIALALYFGGMSTLGFLIVVPLSIAGAAAGMGLAALCEYGLRRARRR